MAMFVQTRCSNGPFSLHWGQVCSGLTLSLSSVSLWRHHCLFSVKHIGFSIEHWHFELWCLIWCQGCVIFSCSCLYWWHSARMQYLQCITAVLHSATHMLKQSFIVFCWGMSNIQMIIWPSYLICPTHNFKTDVLFYAGGDEMVIRLSYLHQGNENWLATWYYIVWHGCIHH